MDSASEFLDLEKASHFYRVEMAAKTKEIQKNEGLGLGIQMDGGNYPTNQFDWRNSPAKKKDASLVWGRKAHQTAARRGGHGWAQAEVSEEEEEEKDDVSRTWSKKAEAAELEWIVDFREEMRRYEDGHAARGVRIKYPFVVPKQMKLLKESAYSPQGNLYLGLNSRSHSTQEHMNMTRLKANWASNYIRWAKTTGWEGGWEDFVHGLDFDVDTMVECYELGFQYLPSAHKDQLKEMLAADALFVVMYLLYLAGLLPHRGFGWLRDDPHFKAHTHYLLNDLFLLDNQIPLGVLETVLEHFCLCREDQLGPSDDKPAGLVQEYAKKNGQATLITLVSKALGSVFDKVFRTPGASKFEVVYAFGSVEQGSARALLRRRGSGELPGVDIGLCDHILDCLLQAICCNPEPARRAKPQNARVGWAGMQGWEFTVPGNFSSIRRLEPKGGYWYDVTKLLLDDGVQQQQPGSTMTREALIESLKVRVPNSQGGVAVDAYLATTTLQGKSSLWVSNFNLEDFITKELKRFERSGDAVERWADGVKERLGTPSPSLGFGLFGRTPTTPEQQQLLSATELNRFITSLLFATSGRPLADSLTWGLGRSQSLKSKLLSALQEVDRVLRSATVVHASGSRVKAFALTLTYFAENMALTRGVLDELYVSYDTEDAAVFKTDVNVAKVQVLVEALAGRPPEITDFQKFIDKAFLHLHISTTASAEHPEPDLELEEPGKKQYKGSVDNWTIESARRLKRVGITLGPCDMVCEVGMTLKPKAVLCLPKLDIDDSTDSLFRNLAAWERVKGACPTTPFACYIKLMDNLIDTGEDVAIMRDAGLLVHSLGSNDAVATMWNELARGLSFYPSEQWANTLLQVNIRTKDWRKQYWAEFVQNYFSRPWHATATLAATILLVLTVIQTILAALQA